MVRYPIVSTDLQVSKLFPRENAQSPLLLSLCVLRDDLGYEFSQLRASPGDRGEDCWRFVYMLRRIAITIHTLYGTFNDEVRPHVDVLCPYADLRADISDTIAKLKSADRALKPLRHSMSAHVDSKLVREFIGNCGETEGHVCIDSQDGKITSFRGITYAMFASVWPDAQTPEALNAKLKDQAEALGRVVHKVSITIDYLVMMHGGRLGLRGFPRFRD